MNLPFGGGGRIILGFLFPRQLGDTRSKIKGARWVFGHRPRRIFAATATFIDCRLSQAILDGGKGELMT